MVNYLSLKNIGESLFNDDLKDIIVDIAELSIDSFLDSDSVLSQIPVVKTAIGTYKTLLFDNLFLLNKETLETYARVDIKGIN